MTCTNEAHVHVRAQVEYRLAGGAGPVDQRAGEMLRTLRAWPDAWLLVGECECHSTLAIEVEREIGGGM